MWDNLDKCPMCFGEFVNAPDIWGKMKDYHKVPSKRFDGYFTFVEGCVSVEMKG